jgi:hypothetical protein
MGQATAPNWDQRTLAFYVTLLGLVILDLMLMVWILSPRSQSVPLTSLKHYAGPMVNDSAKPSPFEVDLKASAPKRTPRVRIAQASIVVPASVKAAN